MKWDTQEFHFDFLLLTVHVISCHWVWANPTNGSQVISNDAGLKLWPSLKSSHSWPYLSSSDNLIHPGRLTVYSMMRISTILTWRAFSLTSAKMTMVTSMPQTELCWLRYNNSHNWKYRNRGKYTMSVTSFILGGFLISRIFKERRGLVPNKEAYCTWTTDVFIPLVFDSDRHSWLEFDR